MKVLIFALAVIVLCEARSRRAAPDLREKFKEVKEKFPKDEWDRFWSKMTGVLGDQKADFEKQLEANKGNMDLTLEEFKDKLQDNYPIVNQQWARVKGKWDEGIDKMDETTIKDIFKYVKQNAEQILGKPITAQTVQQFVDNLKNYMVTYYNRIGAAW